MHGIRDYLDILIYTMSVVKSRDVENNVRLTKP